MWGRAGARIAEIDAAEFRAKRAALELGPLVVHANYLINLATSDPVMRVRSIQAYHDEIVRALALGADYLVVHPGSCCAKAPGRAKTIEEAIRDVAQAIRQAARGMRLCQEFDDLRDCRPRLLLENTSGMGAAIGSRFEELEAILDLLQELPVGICLDTAHAFHAGYAIHTETGLEDTITALDRTVGLGRVGVLHVNDSKTPFGSHLDRHEHIGKGKIGLEGLRRILTHPALSAAAKTGRPGRAFLLETPIDKPGDDRRNVGRLWQLMGIAAEQAPRAQDGFSMVRKQKAPRTPAAQPRATLRSNSSPRPGEKRNARSPRIAKG